MSDYALSEMHSIISGLPRPPNDRAPEVRYLCAMVAELAYYHIPEWELDNKKRAMLVPCDAYQLLVQRGIRLDVIGVLRQLDAPRAFVVADRGVVAIGVELNKFLFIGFRGTQFLFDWRTNLRSRLAPVGSKMFHRPGLSFTALAGRLHSGFAEEALRISARIIDNLKDLDLDIEHAYFSGHSLGGAVAAIAENFVRLPTSVCMFGAPKYADLSSYITSPFGPATQVRRPGDIVPTIPPRAFGYTDHPYEHTTSGAPYADPTRYSSTIGGILRWAEFLFGKFEAHKMEQYRQELGTTAGARLAASQLIPLEKLTRRDIDSPPSG